MVSRKLYSLIACFLLLSGCTHAELYEHEHVKEAQVTDRTRATRVLENIPAPNDKIAVALYEFQDQTGQFKNNDKYTDYSSAVTKGGHALLTKALLDAGNRQWFTVIERGGLKNLLQERQIIKIMRGEYGKPTAPMPKLPPLLYGGMLLEGGIVSYDSNIITGGAGAIYLGVGGSAQYRRDLVTVALRAISVQTGEVVLSVTSSKTLYSVAWDTNVLKYISFDDLLQAEAGFTLNEPTQLAVRQAVETAVYSLIMEGVLDNVWSFRDPAAGQKAIAEYIARRDGPPPVQVAGMANATAYKAPEDTVAAVPVKPVVTITPTSHVVTQPQPALQPPSAVSSPPVLTRRRFKENPYMPSAHNAGYQKPVTMPN